jgi:hypothetical protein
MKKYQNKSGQSGVESYDFTEDHIDIQFNASDRIYRYKISKIGSHHLQKMIKFASEGLGLSTYIAQHPEIKENYELI